MKYAKRKNLSRYDVLIIASMIEREAQLARERSLVSAVIYNRLKEGMPLGIDATIRYSTNNWQRPIRQSELDRQEPYNTRLNRGLPPTPIGNPGLASIKAAAKPANKNYLFYVRKPGKSGEHAFSSTDAQFQRDVARSTRPPAATDDTRLGVCGWPVAHSRSPQMHNAALRTLGLRRLALPAPADPAAPVQGDRPSAAEARLQGRQRDDPAQGAGLRAGGRTRPRPPSAIGAANTLTFNADGTIHADNTDAPGFLHCLNTSLYGKTALVLGAGGSSRAVLYALKQAGVSELRLWNRSPERAQALAAEFQATVSAEPADIIVNCTAIGLKTR